MPAKDKYHDVVIRALQKDGWIINDEQYILITQKRLLWIDLLVSDVSDSRQVLVEVKSFISLSAVEDFANAIGKYLIRLM